MTPEELKEARELADKFRASSQTHQTITRLCDEVERLQRENKCPTRPTCEALARSVMADQVGSS